VRTSHDELTLICIQVGEDVLNKTVTVVPPHEGHEIERDFVGLSTVETGVGVCTDVGAVASKVECFHDVRASNPYTSGKSPISPMV
jgi:hypothetical protein